MPTPTGREPFLKTADFDYDLPDGAVALEPAEPRDAARLLVVPPGDEPPTDAVFRDLPDLLEPGDLLVLNDTRVLWRRLVGRRATGGAVELLVTGHLPDGSWRALANPGRKLGPGEVCAFEGTLDVEFMQRGGDGSWSVRFPGCDDPEAAFEELGRAPLPPYLRRPRGSDDRILADRRRYQTVFAQVPGSIAAPTAGLHFTDDVLRALAARDIAVTRLTLHVGEGTFRPVEAADPADHVMHTEQFDVPEAAKEAVRAARERGGRVVACGTTVARVLEARADQNGVPRAGPGETDIFLCPGHRFRGLDILLTNFHLPRSTLLMLVAALVGRERALGLYRTALGRGYRFFSYGDACLFFRPSS